MDLVTYLAERPYGFKSEFAKKLGISKSYLRQIATGYSPMPIYLAKKIEQMTDGIVSKSELRPDVWD